MPDERLRQAWEAASGFAWSATGYTDDEMQARWELFEAGWKAGLAAAESSREAAEAERDGAIARADERVAMCEKIDGELDRREEELNTTREESDSLSGQLNLAEAKVGRLREALSFYADDRRYMVDEDAVLVRSAGVDESVLDEGGERARAALSPVRVNPMPDERDEWIVGKTQGYYQLLEGDAALLTAVDIKTLVPKSSREAAKAEVERLKGERDKARQALSLARSIAACGERILPADEAMFDTALSPREDA